MEIKTKFNIGDEVWFFRDWYEDKDHDIHNIVKGVVIGIKAGTTLVEEKTIISYILYVNYERKKIPESYLCGSRSEIISLVNNQTDCNVNDSVREAYERLERELDLI